MRVRPIRCRLERKIPRNILGEAGGGLGSQQNLIDGAAKSWRVLGGFDFCNFDIVDQITALADSAKDPNVLSIGTRTTGVDLLLFRAIDLDERVPESPTCTNTSDGSESKLGEQSGVSQSQFRPSREDFDAFESDLVTNEHSKPKAILMFWFSLSAVAIDSCETIAAVTAVFSTVENEIYQKFDASGIRIFTYRTLGGPDIVAMTEVRSDNEISKATVAMQDARAILVSSDGASGGGGQASCHVIASTNSMLIYRNAKSLAQDWLDESANVTVSTAIKCAPGHEKYVSDELGKRLVIANSSSTVTQSVVASGEFVTVWRSESVKCYFAIIDDLLHDLTFGQSSVYVSRTLVTVAGVELKQCSYRASAHFLAKFQDRIDKCKQKILKNVQSLCTEYQYVEMERMLRTWEIGFRRNENANSIRDLIPFFCQLGEALEEISPYSKHDTFIDYSIDQDLSKMLEHGWRALRTRLEYRIDESASFLPNALDYGANKLVNAYTIMAWLSWSMFIARSSKPAERDPGSGCLAKNFGVMVCAGNIGRVNCEELFRSWRRLAEWPSLQILGDDVIAKIKQAKEKTDRPKFSSGLLYDRGNDQWNANLLLMSISGPALFRPEIAIVNCLHEMAEFTHWAYLPPNDAVGCNVSIWTIRVFCRKLLASVLYSHDVCELGNAKATTNSRNVLLVVLVSLIVESVHEGLLNLQNVQLNSNTSDREDSTLEIVNTQKDSRDMLEVFDSIVDRVSSGIESDDVDVRVDSFIDRLSQYVAQRFDPEFFMSACYESVVALNDNQIDLYLERLPRLVKIKRQGLIPAKDAIVRYLNVQARVSCILPTEGTAAVARIASDFRAYCERQCLILDELLADVGMILALRTISEEVGLPLTKQEVRKSIVTVFKELFRENIVRGTEFATDAIGRYLFLISVFDDDRGESCKEWRNRMVRDLEAESNAIITEINTKWREEGCKEDELLREIEQGEIGYAVDMFIDWDLVGPRAKTSALSCEISKTIYERSIKAIWPENELERDLLRKFLAVWRCQNDDEVSALRVKLLFDLWAKSQIFSENRMYSVVAESEAKQGDG